MTNQLLFFHVVVFAVSALVCLASIPRARTIQHQGTREGFVVFLLAVGLWSLGYVGYLIAPSVFLKEALYLVGFSAAFVAVGAFLYLAAAYTGRPPRQMPYRRTIVGVFLVVIVTKFTNPWHQLYLTTEWAADPFPHLAVEYNLLYWVLLGLSYAVVAVGFFMILERFYHTGTDTRPLLFLLVLTGIPAVGTIVAGEIPQLLPFMYEPPGVAIFAVGTLFVYLDRFESVQFTSQTDSPLIFLGGDQRILSYNRAAVDEFPTLQGSFGKSIQTVDPELTTALSDPATLVTSKTTDGDRSRIYQPFSRPVTEGEGGAGQVITLTDVTERERYRRELEETNQQLEQFAGVVSHDLRNPLNVAQGHLEIAQETDDSPQLQHISEALTRIETLIEDLLTLAREGEQLGDVERVDLAEVTRACWQSVETAHATIVVDTDWSVEADRSRLQQLLENLFRNAVEHGGTEVTITVGELDDGFYVEDDGPGIPEERRQNAFEIGHSTAVDGNGLGLGIVEQVVDAHGWELAITESAEGGARFEVHTERQ
ncbi:ATP-binding protein [Natrarchaeobius sp. A-rgal3]|uniref:sensor histidine kinase n=1 Tax=Natrarchaeobius versutus TaxID=1679078 RepID=UPI00350EAAA9